MKRLLFYILTIWIVLWLQVLHNHYFGGSRFSVNLVLIIVLYFGLMRGPIVGQSLGFIWGLLTDASSLGLMGMHTLLYALAGYVAGMLRRQLDETKTFTQSFFTFAASLAYVVLYVGLDHVFTSAERPVGWQMAIQPVVNALLAPAFFWFMRWWSGLWQLFPLEH